MSCLSMNGYVQYILDYYHRILPNNPQLSPNKHTDIFMDPQFSMPRRPTPDHL